MRVYDHEAKSFLLRFQIPSPYSHRCFSFDDCMKWLEKNPERVCAKNQEGTFTCEGKPQEVLPLLQDFFEKNKGEVFLTPSVEVKSSYYLAIEADLERGGFFLLAAEGGPFFEDTISRFPERVYQEEIEEKTLHLFQIERIFTKLKMKKTHFEQFQKIVTGLVQAFFFFDASLIELDPFVLTEEGVFLALSVSMEVDSKSLFRQKEMGFLLKERKEEKSDFQGIGCIGSDESLSRFTRDLIKRLGKEAFSWPLTKKTFQENFQGFLEALSKNVGVCALFLGLDQCEETVLMMKKIKKKYPKSSLIVYVEGSFSSKARSLLGEFNMIEAVSLEDAVKKASSLVKG